MYGSKAKQIIFLLHEGLPYNKIVKIVGCSKGTIAYHAKKHQIINKNISKTKENLDWSIIQDFYNSGHSGKDCREQFEISKPKWTKAVKTGLVRVKIQVPELKEVLVNNSSYSRKSLKKRLLEHKLLEYRCYMEDCILNCKNPIWRGQSIVLFLDHINGVNNDNRLENLRMLCSNCHSQTDTYAGRNKTNQDRNPKPGYISPKKCS